MTTLEKSQAESEWVDDEELSASAIDFDDDYNNDESIARDNLNEHRTMRRHDRVPLWRLIEMSSEDRELRMELADFGDYDDFERFDRRFADELSV